MAYVVHVWEHPDPQSLDEADALHVRLSGIVAPSNTKFVQLAQALIESFPVEVGGSTDMALSKGGASGAWVESQPDGHTDTAVYSLAIYEDEGLDQLLPVLVGVALSLGLTVYDDQAGRAYLPGGWVLDETGRAALAQGDAQALSYAHAISRAKALVAPPLASCGFDFGQKPNRYTNNIQLFFQRRLGAVEQKLSINLTEGSGLDLQLLVSLNPQLAGPVQAMIGLSTLFVTLGPCKALSAFAKSAEESEHPEFTVVNAGDLDTWLLGYVQVLRDEVLPLLDACHDAASVLDLIRHPDRFAAAIQPAAVAVAIAFALGENDIESLAAELETRPDSTSTAEGYRNMVEDLRKRPELLGSGNA